MEKRKRLCVNPGLGVSQDWVLAKVGIVLGLILEFGLGVRMQLSWQGGEARSPFSLFPMINQASKLTLSLKLSLSQHLTLSDTQFWPSSNVG